MVRWQAGAGAGQSFGMRCVEDASARDKRADAVACEDAVAEARHRMRAQDAEGE